MAPSKPPSADSSDPSDPSGTPPPSSSSTKPPSSTESEAAMFKADHPILASDVESLNKLEMIAARIPHQYITPFCGGAAGVASGMVTCPLDVIKTKLQAQGGFARRIGRAPEASAMYRGIFGTARTIWLDDGLRGMYRGLGPMLLGYLPTWAVYLTVYERAKDFYFEKTDNWWIARGSASLTAGACSTVVTNPIWVIKTRLMSQSSRVARDGYRAPWHYTSTWDAAKKMYASEGFRVFYSGLTPALLGLTHVAVQFPLYEYFKTQFTGFGMGEHPDESQSSIHWLGVSAATFLSKVCASTATYPHEVLRTRLQTQQRSNPSSPEGISFRGGANDTRFLASSSDGMPNPRPRYSGVIKTCQTIIREEGWRAFYAGIGVNLVRAVPAAMTTMLTYEFLQKLIHDMQAEGLRKIDAKRAKELKEDGESVV